MICCRSDNESYEDSDSEVLGVDFEQPINQAEEEEDEDWGLPPDLLRIVEREEKEIKPHKEETEVINLGTSEEKKEVKVGTCVSANVREELVALLRGYQDIFT